MPVEKILPKNSAFHSLAFVLKGVLEGTKEERIDEKRKWRTSYYSEAKSITLPFSAESSIPVWMVKLNPLLPLYWTERFLRVSFSWLTHSIDKSIFVLIRSLHARGNRSENRRNVSFEFVDRLRIIESVVSTKNVKHRISDAFEFRSKHLPERKVQTTRLFTSFRSFDSQREEYRQKLLLDSTVHH